MQQCCDLLGPFTCNALKSLYTGNTNDYNLYLTPCLTFYKDSENKYYKVRLAGCSPRHPKNHKGLQVYMKVVHPELRSSRFKLL